MLQIKSISKTYRTGDLVQNALDGVSLNLRDSEFVAILGPSGSGKTTLLNVIGGLDRYDCGDLIINCISTRQYRDRDWDSYRNHTIGFVFQSYNLIPHQSILANVELALTISGISRKERRERAKKALEEVGLGDQLHKRPNQMSGGQMQRVAIARALVNDPQILLADEPTGALDSETSVQVMELLKEVAKTRLVVMVTHNPELAESYATRIVRLKDGRITDDSDPYILDETGWMPPRHRNMGKASMSFLTALSLSFNNLRTKMGRTFLTAFAGSIGIIGIALILSLSNGVNSYISDIQKSTMTAYPVTIEAQSFDFGSMIANSQENMLGMMGQSHELDGVYSNGTELEMVSSFTASITENNLTEFKKYLDDPESEIWQYVGENGVVYSYSTKFDVYTYDPENTLVNTDGSTLTAGGGMGMGGMANSSMEAMVGSNSPFEELMSGGEGQLVSPAITESYELLHGAWPIQHDEIVLVLDGNNEIDAATLYQLGLLPTSEYRELMKKIEKGETVDLETQKWSYEDICAKRFYLIPQCDLYLKRDSGTFREIDSTSPEFKTAMENAVELRIAGIIRPKADADNLLLTKTLAYSSALTQYLIDHTAESDIVKAQQASGDVNVLTGTKFDVKTEADKLAAVKDHIAILSVREKAALYRELFLSAYANDPEMYLALLNMTDAELAQLLDEYAEALQDPKDSQMLMIYALKIGESSYDDNLEAFGFVSLDAPSGIDIYVDSFEDKEAVTACIDRYNATASEENQITYTDYVGLLMSSVTTIVDVISYVLVAFVSVSLVVSSIMIGIITYISVLERTKEIGILRAIGASKGNISQVFNAETFIVGLCAGLLGVGISLLLLIPGNAIIHALTDAKNVNASLPVLDAVVLVLLSMGLTVLGGLIPAKKAARKDPVAALRTE